MEFLGVGYQEILLVLLLMLLVVGPERMPGVAYQIGRAVRTLQRYARVVRDEFSDEFEYIDEQYRVVKGEIDTTRTSIREEQRRLDAELRKSEREIQTDLKTALPPPDAATATASPGAAATPAKPAGDGTEADGGRGGPPLVF